jgi:hypothetical protein
MLCYFLKVCVDMCSPKKKCKKTQTKIVKRDKITQTYDANKPDFLIVHPDGPDIQNSNETDLLIC